MSVAINYSNNPRFHVVEFIQKLRKADFTQEQSEILAQETERMFETAINSSKEDIQTVQQSIKDDIKSKDLATKGDITMVSGEIRESELRLQKEIEVVRKEIEVVRKEIKDVELKIADTKNDLIKWVLGTGIAATFALCGAMFTMFKFMLH